MLRLAPDGLEHLLCIGAHSDDIEIGCGGTVLRLLETYPGLAVTWVVLCAEGERAAEAQASAARFLAKAGSAQVHVEAFPERFLPYEGAAVKRWFDELGRRCSPDLVLTHRRADEHQDHRLVGELTWNTFRNSLVLEYEIAKYEGDLTPPNVFVALDVETCTAKVDAVLQGFPSQRGRYWFTADTLWALLRLRGVEARAPSGFAEGFHGRKLVL